MESVTEPGAIEGMSEKALEDRSALNLPANATRGIHLDTPIDSLRDERITSLLNLLDSDIHAADLKWSLFVAACQNYRWDSCAKPFPLEFVKNGIKDIDYLMKIIDSVSSLMHLKKVLQDEKIHSLKPHVIDLAYWILIASKDIQISSVPKQGFEAVLNLVPSDTVAQTPNRIFKITSKSPPANETMWKQMSDEKKLLHAYHGSRLENFHSILHHGLQQHLNKNSLFGQGVYLSSELSVSLPYSPTGCGWSGSIVGPQLSCVALCEMMDHPDVKCQDKESDPSRSIAKDSMGGEVPIKYYVVRNSDLVRLRYLLVYSKKQASSLEQANRWSIWPWICRHKLLAITVAYVAMLTAVGLSNNHQLHRVYNRLYKQLMNKFKMN